MYSPLIGRTARVVLTKEDFIELVARPRSNWALAERLEGLGINQNLSHFVRANTALNQGGFEQVFAECDIDLLIAELRDIPGWFGSSSRLIRQLEIARDALAVLGNRKSTSEEKKQAEEAIGNAKYQWWTHRTKVLSAFWRGVRRAPERFYDRSAEGLQESHLTSKEAVVESGSGSPSPLVVIFRHNRDQFLYYAGTVLILTAFSQLKNIRKQMVEFDHVLFFVALFVELIAFLLGFLGYLNFALRKMTPDPLAGRPVPKPDTKAV